MDLGTEPVNEREKEIIVHGVGYLFKDTRIAIYIRNDVVSINEMIANIDSLPANSMNFGESFTLVHCLPSYSEDTGIIAVYNTRKNEVRARGYDSQKKLFASYGYLKRKLKENKALILLWNGSMNDPRAS